MNQVRFPSARVSARIARKVQKQEEREAARQLRQAMKKNLPKELERVKRDILLRRREGRLALGYAPDTNLNSSVQAQLLKEVAKRLKKHGYSVIEDMHSEYLTIRWS